MCWLSFRSARFGKQPTHPVCRKPKRNITTGARGNPFISNRDPWYIQIPPLRQPRLINIFPCVNFSNLASISLNVVPHAQPGGAKNKTIATVYRQGFFAWEGGANNEAKGGMGGGGGGGGGGGVGGGGRGGGGGGGENKTHLLRLWWTNDIAREPTDSKIFVSRFPEAKDRVYATNNSRIGDCSFSTLREQMWQVQIIRLSFLTLQKVKNRAIRNLPFSPYFNWRFPTRLCCFWRRK